MDKAELLINLVRGFHYGGKMCEGIDENTEEGRKLNDDLNRMGIVMEELSEEIFDEKINMDFGMIITIYNDPESIIDLINEHKPED